MKKLILVVLPLMLLGCQVASTGPDLRPSLVETLAKRGVSDVGTRRIVLVGGEGGYGHDIQVTITADFLIQEIWDTIHQSRPHKTWAASGFRKLRFYTDAKSSAPAAELLVNATDRCHFEDAFDDAFRCPGMNKILEPLLKAEYERRKATSQSPEPTGPVAREPAGNE